MFIDVDLSACAFLVSIKAEGIASAKIDCIAHSGIGQQLRKLIERELFAADDYADFIVPLGQGFADSGVFWLVFNCLTANNQGVLAEEVAPFSEGFFQQGSGISHSQGGSPLTIAQNPAFDSP